MMRKGIKTTQDEIIEYWFSKINECDMSVDHSEANERCWRCGYKTVLHRCHIIPDSLDGKDSPENLVLLCNRCHREAPNIKDSEFFWDWLDAHKTPLYDTYWTIRGMLEYKHIYGEEIEEVFSRLKIEPNDFTKFISEQGEIASIHFGEGRWNPSTIAGLFRLFIKHISK